MGKRTERQPFDDRRSHPDDLANVSLRDLASAIHTFVNDNGWYGSESLRPQTTRNLAISIAVEAGELLECFQWTERPQLEQLANELADVIIYCLQLANVARIDTTRAVIDKLLVNRTRMLGKEGDAR